jgi:hypothetical protein
MAIAADTTKIFMLVVMERAEMFMGPMFMGLITMNISSPHRRLVTMNN